MDETAVGVGLRDSYDLIPTVGNGLLFEYWFSRLLGECHTSDNAFLRGFGGILNIPLPGSVPSQHGSVRVFLGDERRPGGSRDGFRQAVFTVGVRRFPPQDVGFAGKAAQKVVGAAFGYRHWAGVFAQGCDFAQRVARVAGDGFRRHDGRAVRHFAAYFFNQLPRGVVAIGGHHAVFVLFPQWAAAHHRSLVNAAVGAGALRPAVFGVVFIGGGVGHRPRAVCQQGVLFVAHVVALFGDVGDFPRAVAGHRFPRNARFGGDPVEGPILVGRLVGVVRLHAVDALGHLQAAPGVDVGGRAEPGFLHFEPFAFRSEGGGALFDAPHVVGLRVGVGRLPEVEGRGRQGCALGEDVRVGLGIVAVGGVSGLVAASGPGNGGDDFAPEAVVGPRFHTAVGSRFFRHFPHAVVLIGGFAGVGCAVALDAAGAQIAVAGNGVCFTNA